MTVLMLGNGFDLYHNLLTRYDDFITIGVYLKKKHKNLHCENTNVYSELKELSEYNESIEKNLSVYKDAYSKTNINPSEYSRFLQLLHSNCWFQYFSEIKERDGWVALESQIGDLLQKIKNNDIKDMNCFLDMIKKRNGYSDQMFNHLKGYIFTKEDDDNVLFAEFEDFVKSLKLYLKIFVNDVLCNISETHRFENQFLNKSDYIVSFNYTDTYKQLYHKSAKTIYIHGELNKVKRNSIIVGVNSNESDNVGNCDSRFINYKKYYQRITKHTLGGLKDLLFRLNLTKGQEHKLKVIGHSLDMADEDIITVLFDLFEEITIYYHNDQALDKYVKNLKQMFGAKGLSKMTFSQKIVFEKLPKNNYKKVATQ